MSEIIHITKEGLSRDLGKLIARIAELEAERDLVRAEAFEPLKQMLAKAEAERDAAIAQASEWSRKAGLAEGKLEFSELAGVVEGWRECALKAEAQRIARGVEIMHLHTALYKIQSQAGLPDPAEACRAILKTAGDALVKGGAK